MRSKLILAIAALVCSSSGVAHALYPATQTTGTMTTQGWATLTALNARTDVNEFVVEIFDGNSWTPSTAAVAIPDRLVVPASRPGEPPVIRNVRVLVRLNGAKERDVMVCTKSAPKTLAPTEMLVNTRVCARVKVRSIS